MENGNVFTGDFFDPKNAVFGVNKVAWFFFSDGQVRRHVWKCLSFVRASLSGFNCKMNKFCHVMSLSQ